MSKIDPGELLEHGLFDSESKLPGTSLVDPAIETGVNMSSSSANLMQEARAILTGNSCPSDELKIYIAV